MLGDGQPQLEGSFEEQAGVLAGRCRALGDELAELIYVAMTLGQAEVLPTRMTFACPFDLWLWADRIERLTQR